MRRTLIYSFLSILIVACNSDKLTNSKAKSIIESCLNKVPEQRFVYLKLGKVTFREMNKELLVKYKKLEKLGFLEATLIRDVKSGWNKRKIYNVSLTDKALPYIFEAPEESSSVTMNSFNYEVERIMEVYEIPSLNKAQVKVHFQPANITPFAILSTKDPNQFWVTKITFTKTNDGWKYCDDI
jgi:hypothetical protein